MRNLTCVAVALLALGSLLCQADSPAAAPATQPAARPWGKPAHGFRILAQTDKHQYLPFEPIILTITVQNVSGKYQKVLEMGVIQQDFKCSASDDKGREVARTAYCKAYAIGGDAGTWWFNPGDELVVRVVINHILDMSADGTYSLQVTGPATLPSGSPSSNVVKVIVADDRDHPAFPGLDNSMDPPAQPRDPADTQPATPPATQP